MLVKRGQFDEAIAHYRKALEIKPDYAGAHFNLGMALAGRGQFDEAIAHFQKALEIKPDFARAGAAPLEALPPIISVQHYCQCSSVTIRTASHFSYNDSLTDKP